MKPVNYEVGAVSQASYNLNDTIEVRVNTMLADAPVVLHVLQKNGRTGVTEELIVSFSPDVVMQLQYLLLAAANLVQIKLMLAEQQAAEGEEP